MARCTLRISLLLVLFTAIQANLRAQAIRYDMDTTSHLGPDCKDQGFNFFNLKAKYPERSGHVARRADEALKGLQLSQSGYITFQLIIGCDAQLAKISLQQTSPDYKPIQFPKEVVERLYHFVQRLDEWKAGVYQGKPLAYHTYLSFKIRNGHVAEVAP